MEADVAVVGGGPAGIAAACRAAEAGARVVLLDEGAAPGGQIWRHRPGRPAAGAGRWLARLERSGARVLAGTAVFDATPEVALAADAAGSALSVRAGRLVVATGARERFLPFPGWTLPNVIGVGAAQALLKGGASFRGRRLVVAGSGPLLLPVAALLARDGARLAAVAEQAEPAAVRRFAAGLWRFPAKIVQAAVYRLAFSRTRYRLGVWVASAAGDDRVREAVLTDGRRSWSVACEVLCAAYGLVPNLELPRLLGCAVEGGAVRVDGRQETSVPGVFAAGEPTGVGGVDLALLEGEIAGLAAAGSAEADPRLSRRRARLRRFAQALERAFPPRPELAARVQAGTIVCRCEDVRFGSLSATWTPRQAKLYTRVGMGPCQGRVCGPVLELLFGWAGDSVRPPLKPTAVATLAGDAGGPVLDSRGA
jgi:D-hydroxyproline dehydrogenase subunit alpha